MTTENSEKLDHKSCPITFDRHAPEYRVNFEKITDELHAKCPIAWAENYGGHWVASGMDQLFEIARRSDVLSNENDIDGTQNGYHGISIPHREKQESRGGFLEMNPPEQTDYRKALNPFLSPAAIARWVPIIDEITRACIDERIESGTIDFIDDLANIVPAVATLGLLGLPLNEWEVYCGPVHASVYTPPTSPDMIDVVKNLRIAHARLSECIDDIRDNPRPGLIDALLRASINGSAAAHADVQAAVTLLIGGGFDTTTALTSHALEWLSEHPDERARLSDNFDTMLDSATEEFLRFYTPAVGDGRTISQDVEIAGASFKQGDRLWLSWAMANRNGDIFPNPHEIDLERTGNRHASFGLGIHRCIGSNFARHLFKRMLTQVLARIPDFICDSETTVHYTTVGVINGMRNLPATFTPGKRMGPGIAETIARLQITIDRERTAEPVTKKKSN